MGRTPGAKDKQPRKSREENVLNNLHNPELPEGYNTKRIAFLRLVMPTDLLDKQDAEEMERRFMRYLALCEEYDQKVSNLTAYMAIGITKDEAYEWERQQGVNPARSALMKKVRQFCSAYREGLMADNKVNAPIGIFWQKNYDGLRDVQERVNVNVDPLGDTATLETLRDRYIGTVDAPALTVSEDVDGSEGEE